MPHLRPAGSSPQFLVTFGAGFGSPSPVMGFATFDCADSVALVPEWLYAVNRKTAQAAKAESRILNVDMAPPREPNENVVMTGGLSLISGVLIMDFNLGEVTSAPSGRSAR